MNDSLMIRFTNEPPEIADVVSFVTDPAAGAVCVFLGSIRAYGDEPVTNVEFELWEEGARDSISRIAEAALKEHGLLKMAVVHRVGSIEPGAVVVAVAVSAPHRGKAFDACRTAIDRMKSSLPVWKKEYLASGSSRWVNEAGELCEVDSASPRPAPAAERASPDAR